MKEKSKSNVKKRWILFIFTITFILSMAFSFVANNAIAGLNMFWSFFILIFVILLGILFDLVGVSVTVANEEDFHAQASKKIRGAKTSIKMIKNSAKVANFCSDVIGDICGVLSGAISAIIALKVTTLYGMDPSLQFVFSAVVSAVTVGGKAIFKEVAINNSTKVVTFVSKFISIGKE